METAHENFELKQIIQKIILTSLLDAELSTQK